MKFAKLSAGDIWDMWLFLPYEMFRDVMGRNGVPRRRFLLVVGARLLLHTLAMAAALAFAGWILWRIAGT